MRRIHVVHVSTGELELDGHEAHHARDVLRLAAGARVEVFDDAGYSAAGTIAECSPARVVVRVDQVNPPPAAALQWIIASAVPKGPRADWLVEKLSELGTAAFVPLATERSVVLPEGKSKKERWNRIAAEAAKQSHRSGVMRIEELTSVNDLLEELAGPAWYFSTTAGAVDVSQAAKALSSPSAHPLTLLIGPEGGWTEGEIARFEKAGLTAVTLGRTILRIETAAVAAAVLAAAVAAPALEIAE